MKRFCAALVMLLVLLPCVLLAEGMISPQEALQPYSLYWYTRVAVPAGDSIAVGFPTNYLGYNFQNCDGLTVHIEYGAVDLFPVTAKKGTYWEYQRFQADTWMLFPDIDADTLKARGVAAVCTLGIWVWVR